MTGRCFLIASFRTTSSSCVPGVPPENAVLAASGLFRPSSGVVGVVSANLADAVLRLMDWANDQAAVRR